MNSPKYVSNVDRASRIRQRVIARVCLMAGFCFGCNALGQELDSNPMVLREFATEEARQAVAVDATHFFAIGNSSIGKYDRVSGERVGGWQATEELNLHHLNSGVVIDHKLYCCNSNYPEFPAVSSVEVFSTVSLEHVDTHSFGIYEGSLTWVDRSAGTWWAVFAHYSRNVNDDPFSKPHTYTSLVQFDDQWRRMAAWVFPREVLDRFAPSSCSGGFWGPDGKLYCTGHDLGEIYVLSLPRAGSVLKHERTLAAPITGQGIAHRDGEAVFFGIHRPTRSVIEFQLPGISRNTPR